jgi:predicted phage terminase large subunit-like protein
MAALQYVDVPGYSAIIFRRTFNDLSLPNALMDRAKQWLMGEPGVVWNETKHMFTFPSGAKLAFGYLESEADKYRYQGAEFQGIFIDELTQFTETQYTYLLSRLRKLKSSPVPLRMWSATNPGGVGHEWVKQRFLIEGPKNGRVFIPARLEDNHYIDIDSYLPNLMQLDPVTRKQLLSGDWDVKEFYMFKRSWLVGGKDYPDRRIIETSEVPNGLRWVRVWDLAKTAEGSRGDPDYTSGLKAGIINGIMYIIDLQHFRKSPQGIEQQVTSCATIDGKTVPIHIEEENGAAGKNLLDQYRRNALLGYIVIGEKPTGEKSVRAAPFSSACEAGNVKLVRGEWINCFLDELESFPEGAHDDQVDVAAYAFNILAGKRQSRYSSMVF